MRNLLAKDSRHNVVHTDSDLEEMNFENTYVLGQVLPPYSYSGVKPLDLDEMDNNPLYTTYMVMKDDSTLQVALFSGTTFVSEPREALMIFHPNNIEWVPFDKICYAPEHILLPPEGYSWKYEPGKTRVRISDICRRNGY